MTRSRFLAAFGSDGAGVFMRKGIMGMDLVVVGALVEEDVVYIYCQQ